MANSPAKAYRNNYVLESTTAAVPGNVKRDVSLIYGTNQDWTATPVITAYLNGYGGCPGALNYYADLTVWSGSQSITYTRKISPNAWNLLKINIGNWAYKNAVSRLDISFYTDSTQVWNGKFQVDDISRNPDNFPLFTILYSPEGWKQLLHGHIRFIRTAYIYNLGNRYAHI